MQPYEEKRDAYAADVTYGTNSEFGFDYLRDNMATSLEEKVQHGGRPKPEEGKSPYHTFAIVDEVDSILIDEARTPLIISGAPEQAADLYQKFAKLAPQMQPGKPPEGLDPRAKKQFVADFDYEFDEKHKTVAVTERGVAKAERFLRIDHLNRAENGPLSNHLIQSLKAESLYKRDVDYAVIDGEAKIIDEFTGRILEGRRWSEGLHRAMEAKEGVQIQEENQTVATITYQNYFRRYDKLAGMTGTAITEATEFMKIYELQVVEIPTNRPMVRKDQNDQIYKTKEGKWRAVLKEIEWRHEKKQPVLVGTISVEVSELLSERLDQFGIRHTVLNAKPEHAQHEGETIAEAGRAGAVTIATDMAGRGVDIKLGGNPEHLTTLEVAKLPKQIEMPRRKVEEQNFLIRNRVLEYDDVMNQQREVVYEYRDGILEGRDMGEEARQQIAEAIARTVEEYTPGDFVEDWDVDGVFTQLRGIWDVDVDPSELDVDQLDRDELKRKLVEDAHDLYDEREEELGDELMRALERYLLLETIDQRWREHLYDMDYLREVIHLRGFAQIDPLVAYKNEAFTLFQDLMHAIWSDFARMIS